MKLCRILLVVTVAYAALAKEKGQTVHRTVVVTAEDEKIRDAKGYAAIAEIHREIDDDNSGSIDHNETAGFIKDDMKMRSSDSQKRANEFHEDDSAITVDDLWEAWFESPERAWNTEEIKHWLTNVVNLPMYAEKAGQLKMDGSHLPLLAAQNSTYMSQKMGIKSSVHRQLLRLKALDIVLFGYRPVSNKTKDIILGLLLLLLTTLLIVYLRQKKRAIRQVTELSNRLDMLKNMETELENAQKKWKEERNNSESMEESNAAEVVNLRIQLEEAERRLEQNGACSGTPLALQPLLRKTCEHEMAYLEKQRQECLREMKDAIELVDRLQKKQGSVLSSLKLATGASSASDQVDSKIFALRSRMEKIHGLTRDTQDRWMQIESLCGFPILYGSETGLSHSASSHHFNSNKSDSSSISSKSVSNGNHYPIITHNSQQPSIARSTAQPVPTPISNGITQTEHRTNPIRMVPVPHAESAPLFSDDSESVVSSDKKKKRGIFKIFKKSTSKGSLQNGSLGSNMSSS